MFYSSPGEEFDDLVCFLANLICENMTSHFDLGFFAYQ